MPNRKKESIPQELTSINQIAFWQNNNVSEHIRKTARVQNPDLLDNETENIKDLLNDVHLSPEKKSQFDTFLSTNFSYESYYSFLQQLLSAHEKLIKVIIDYGIELGTEMLAKISDDLGEEYAELLIEPALATKLDEFLDFCKKNPDLCKSPKTARENFIKKCGENKVFVYRGIALTREEADNYLSTQTHSNALRMIRKGLNGFSTDKLIFGGTTTMIQDRVNGFSKASQFISISRNPSIAIAVGSIYASGHTSVRSFLAGLSQNPHLLVMKINPYYLIQYGRYLPYSSSSNTNPHSQSNTFSYKDYQSGETKNAYFNDPKVESFLEILSPNQAVSSLIHIDPSTNSPSFKIPE